MAIEKLDTEVRLPFDEEVLQSLKPEVIEYISDLVKILQDLLEKISIVSNLAVDMSDGDAIYSRTRDAAGDYPVGTWRLRQEGNNWLREVQLTAGTWTKAGTFTRPKT